MQVNISAMLCDKRTVCPEVPPPWQLTGINIAGRNAPRSKARCQREKTMMQTNFQSHYTLQRVAALYLCVLLYSAAGWRGNPMPDYLTINALVSG